MKKDLPLSNEQRGFTLFETVIAIFIFGIFATALMLGSQTALLSTNQIQTKQIAMWVAENQLIQLQQKARLNSFPALGESKNPVDMAGQTWLVKTNISETDDDDILRIEVSVFEEVDETLKSSLVVLVGFLGRH